MPTLVIEDGTKIADANSYIDLDDLELFAEDRNLTIANTDEANTVFILKAMDYIESRKFLGQRTWIDQSLSWPRTEVYIDGIPVGSDVVPELLKKAACQLVVEQVAGVLLYPNPRTSSVEGFVTRKTVGPLTKEYSAMYGMASSFSPITIASVELFLRPLISFGKVSQTVRA